MSKTEFQFAIDGLKTINFECDKVIVKDKSLETIWSEGVTLNFEDYATLVFSVNGKTYRFVKE